MLKFAVCDDEPLTAQEIAGRLAVCLEEKQIAGRVSIFESGRALLENGGGFDAVFLDIRMEEPDGMETARQLRRQGESGLLIFVTAVKEQVFDAFQVEAWDYLLKPLDGGRFRQTVDRALAQLERRSAKTVVIRRGNACQVIPLAEVLYCEVLGRKLYLHTEAGEVIDCYGRMEELERRLDRRFFRCHRSYLVNLDWVRGHQDGQVTLFRGETVPVSRLRERELTQALLRCMREREL